MIQFRHYTNQPGITEDYHKVRQFFIELGYCEFTYARWDWMTTHSYLDCEAIGKIGLWEDNDRLVGVATFDTRLGCMYCLTYPEYAHIKKDMLTYAMENLCDGDTYEVIIAANDRVFQDIAEQMGFVPSKDGEADAIFYTAQTSTVYSLPEGFKIASLKEAYRQDEYLRVLWKGFNHELNGEGPFVYTEEKKHAVDAEMIRPNVDLNLKVAVVAPDGHFASYCGMWYDSSAGFAVIEPVATDPDYRKMGLGKAVVLEGIKRVKELGAKYVYVGSSQQFYYSIGMRPYAVSTVWKKKK